MQFAKTILDFLFPPRCEVCKSLGPDCFCAKCRSQVSYLKPSAFVHSVGIYENTLSRAIMRFKYNKKTALAKPLGELMAKYLKNTVDTSNLNYFIPVPLHQKRFHERGFNHADLLCQELSNHFGIPTLTGLLMRTRETKPQFDLHPKDRLINVRGAFAVQGFAHIKNKKVMLVDDIYTTGATISECTRVLKESGAQEVHILTLSRAINL